jgi:hypothetical protein
MDEQTRGGNASDDGRCPSGIDLDRMGMQDVKRQVKDQAGTLVREAREEGSRILEDVGEQAHGIFEEGKGRVAEQVRAVADSLKNGCGDRDMGAVGRYARQAGDKLTEFADTIRDASPRELGQRAEGFARQRPEVFLGGALVTGVLIGRFLRSHRPREAATNWANLPDRRPGFSENPAFGERVDAGESGFGAGSEIGPGIGAAATGIGPDAWRDDEGGRRADLEGGV